MPELPEVETVRRGLSMKLPGRKIAAVEVLRPDSIGAPTVPQFIKGVTGQKFVDIARRGKYLLFHFHEGGGMVAHLRMSGRFLVSKSKIVGPHVRVVMKLDDESFLAFEDMRVFGRLWYVASSQHFEKIVPALAELGVEPLTDLTAEYLLEALKNKKSQSIKAALLDQTVIAGVGNIYADESLHLSGINPLRPASQLKLEELRVLSAKVTEVLADAIKAGGSTLRNYTDSSGVNGNYQRQAWVYGRTGAPCRSCEHPIERVKIAGRSSHFCANCQPQARARKRPQGSKR